MDPALYKEQVLQRYKGVPGIAAGWWPSRFPVGLNGDFINLLVRAFEEDPGFTYREFRNFPISVIIDYVRRTHLLYLNKTLQEMEQSLDILAQAYNCSHPLLDLLNDFYLEYKTDLIGHIREEDEKLLPYIEFLIRSMNSGFEPCEFYIRTSGFSIKKFLDSHEDHDIILQDIKTKVLTYEPPLVNRFIFQVLLNQLDFFSHDLRVHGMIEDQVLIPCAREMEQKLMREFLTLAGKN